MKKTSSWRRQQATAERFVAPGALMLTRDVLTFGTAAMSPALFDASGTFTCYVKPDIPAVVLSPPTRAKNGSWHCLVLVDSRVGWLKTSFMCPTKCEDQ